MTGAAQLALVFLGAGTGGALRHAVGLAALRAGVAAPWATLGINVLGSGLLGLLLGWLAARADGEAWRLAMGTGLLGGFTTFSAFSVQAIELWSRAPASALAYVALSVLLSIAAAGLGLQLAGS